MFHRPDAEFVAVDESLTGDEPESITCPECGDSFSVSRAIGVAISVTHTISNVTHIIRYSPPPITIDDEP